MGCLWGKLLVCSSLLAGLYGENRRAQQSEDCESPLLNPTVEELTGDSSSLDKVRQGRCCLVLAAVGIGDLAGSSSSDSTKSANRSRVSLGGLKKAGARSPAIAPLS